MKEAMGMLRCVGFRANEDQVSKSSCLKCRNQSGVFRSSPLYLVLAWTKLDTLSHSMSSST